MESWRIPRQALLITFFVTGLSLTAKGGLNASLAFGEKSNTAPLLSFWSGSAWSSNSSLPSVGGEPYWVVHRACPVRDELALAVLDGNNDLNVAFYSGSSWGGVTEVTTNTGSNTTRPYDLAYMQISGLLLFVYWDGTTQKLYFRTWDGTILSGATVLALPDANAIRFVRLIPKPNSNEILLLLLSSAQGLHAAVWNGAAFTTISTLEANTSTSTMECFHGAYESNAGRALVVYTVSGSNQPRYRIGNGGGWTAAAFLPSIGAVANWIRLAADPNSNVILMASLDNGGIINVNKWDGIGWGTNQVVETDVHEPACRNFDLAYEKGNSLALLTYAEKNKNTIMYRTYNGLIWSLQETGPNLGRKPMVIQLAAGALPGEIFVAAADDRSDLHALRWVNSSWTSDTTVESDLGGTSSTEPFMFAVSPRKTFTIIRWREVPRRPSSP